MTSPSTASTAPATPGAAPVGVPNFFIDKFRIPPFLLSIYQAAGIEYVPLDELLKTSDIISLHTPNNAETRGMISREKIALMKPTAIFINCARGPIVDNAALAEALNEGRIAGAGIDVFDMEPPIPADYPLVSAKNTQLMPHTAFLTEESLVRRANIEFANVRAYLNI